MKDTYFIKIGNNKNPKGKLYAKYYNNMRNLKTNGLIEKTSTLHKNKKDNIIDYERSNWTQKVFSNIHLIFVYLYL